MGSDQFLSRYGSTIGTTRRVVFFFEIRYNATMKKRVTIFLVVVITAVLVGMTGCTALTGDKHLNVVLNLKREKLNQSTILIFNFKEPLYANGTGTFAAEMFHIHLLKSKKFKVVSLLNDSPWPRLGENEEERLLILLENPRAQNFDYILVGELKDFYDGGINKSRVRMKVRIIEVKTKTTIFLAEHAKESKGKDPHYPMDTKLTKKSRGPKILTEKIIKELIKWI